MEASIPAGNNTRCNIYSKQPFKGGLKLCMSLIKSFKTSLMSNRYIKSRKFG